MKKKKTLLFALFGVGKWGRHYARLLQEIPGVYLKTAVARSQESADEITKTFPTVQATRDASEVWRDSAIDCVVIATPASTHAHLAEQALKAGKHVLVEKPMTATLDEAKRLRAVARRSKKICMAGYQYMYHDAIAALKVMIEKNELGKIHWMNGEHMGSSYRDDIGVFLDAGAHFLSLVKHLFGAEKILQSVGGVKRRNGLDYSASALIAFDALPFLSILCAREGSQKTRRITIMGESAHAIFDDSAPRALLTVYSGGGTKSIPDVAPREPLQNELEHFIHSVCAGKQPVTDAEFGYKINEWADQILRSLK